MPLTEIDPIEEAEQNRLREEIIEDGLDLPELSDTMEEADARAHASRLLFAIGSIDKEMDANHGEHRVLIEWHRARHTERQEALQRKQDYLAGIVRDLFSNFMVVSKGKKSLNLIGGRVGMRAQQDELIVEDDAAVIEFAESNGIDAIVRTKTTVDRKGLRQHMKTKDEAEVDPPGVSLVEREPEFFATPATD